MPKLKTKSGARKRFRVKKSGKIKRSRAFRRHILTSKSKGRKTRLRGSAYVHKADVAAIKKLFPYA